MKRLFHLKLLIKAHIMWALIAFSVGAIGQNLVPNYSFENYIFCPNKMNAFPPPPWYIPTNNNGEYCNACDTSGYLGVPAGIIKGVPNFQYARTGVAYIYLDYRNGPTRTYIQLKLFDSLKAGHYYYAEHFVNVPNPMKYACNNIGMLFTNKAIYADTNISYAPVIPANPQVVNFNNPIIADTLNWIKVSGVFKAQGGEQYLTLGNFKDNAHTNILQIQSNGYGGAGYYIDDVSVIPLDSMQLKADAGRDTTITIGDSAFIGSYTNGIDTIQWLQNGTTVIDTARPGFWVYPTTNTYYVVTQTVNGFTSSDTVWVTVNPLPVVIKNYELIIDNGIQVNAVENVWTTSTEINLSHFNVQRSLNGVTFETVGTVKSKGAGKYSLTPNPSTPLKMGATYYFRLEVVDKNGSKTYSDIRKININEYIKVYPNPTKGNINIELPTTGKWNISISDIEGRVLWQQKCNGCEGIIQHNLEGSKGMCFIKITNLLTGIQTIKKIILQ